MKASELITALQQLVDHAGDQEVTIDDGFALRMIDDIDQGASDEGIIIWPGDVVVEDKE